MNLAFLLSSVMAILALVASQTEPTEPIIITGESKIFPYSSPVKLSSCSSKPSYCSAITRSHENLFQVVTAPLTQKASKPEGQPDSGYPKHTKRARQPSR